MSSARRFALNLPLTVTSLTWGFNFVAIKVLQPEMNVKALSLVRYATMWALLLLICRLRGESLKYRREDTARVLTVGMVSMGIYMILFMEGMARTGAAEGAIVLATSPVLTYLLSCKVGQERFHSGALAGSLVAFLGVSIVILGGAASGRGSLAGDLLILASAFAWAASAVMMRPLVERYSPLQVFTMSMPGALPLLLPYGLGAALAVDYGSITPVGWAMFAQISVMSGVIAFVCFYVGVRQIGASGATLYQYFVPPLAALFSWLVLHKALVPMQFMGLIVVLTGVILATRARARAALDVQANRGSGEIATVPQELT